MRFFSKLAPEARVQFFVLITVMAAFFLGLFIFVVATIQQKNEMAKRLSSAPVQPDSAVAGNGPDLTPAIFSDSGASTNALVPSAQVVSTNSNF